MAGRIRLGKPRLTWKTKPGDSTKLEKMRNIADTPILDYVKDYPHLELSNLFPYNPIMANENEMNLKVLDKEGLLQFLRSLGTETISKVKMTYLGKPKDDSFYIRIEEISDADGNKKFLTAKGGFKTVNDVNERKEVTIPFSVSPKQYLDFLTLIGMELRDSKLKIRHHFHIDDLEITLDEWNVAQLGDRLEIEGVNESKVKEFASRIVNYCDPTPSK